MKAELLKCAQKFTISRINIFGKSVKILAIYERIRRHKSGLRKYFFLKRACMGERVRGRKSQTDSLLSAQPGLNLTTLRS